MMNPETLLQNLQHFCGSEQYYKHWLGLCYTDGVNYLAENAQCLWLIDAIASHQPRVQKIPRLRDFQLWFLHVGEAHKFIKPTAGNKAVLTCWEDAPKSGDKPVVRQNIPFTDFPLPEIKLYVRESILMLPDEN